MASRWPGRWRQLDNDQAKQHSAAILELETALAKASKSRVDLRDPIANYHKATVAAVATNYPHLPLKLFLAEAGLGSSALLADGDAAQRPRQEHA